MDGVALPALIPGPGLPRPQGSERIPVQLDTETGPAGSFLNDLAVDDERGFVYIADVGGAGEPALVTVDIDNRSSRRFSASPALRAENLDLVVDGRVIGTKGIDGKLKPARIAVNPSPCRPTARPSTSGP